LEVRVVVEPEAGDLHPDTMTEAYPGPGVLVHSGPFTGTVVFPEGPDAGKGVGDGIGWLAAGGGGRAAVRCRLRGGRGSRLGARTRLPDPPPRRGAPPRRLPRPRPPARPAVRPGRAQVPHRRRQLPAPPGPVPLGPAQVPVRRRLVLSDGIIHQRPGRPFVEL